MREINAMAVRCDWVLPGLTEGALLTGSTTPQGIAEFYLERGVQQVAVKNGGLGAELFTAAGERFRLAAFAVDTVDTVGAGDGFAAGLISGGLDGLSPAAALERAVAVGALATTSKGDSDGLPDARRARRVPGAGMTDAASGADRLPGPRGFDPLSRGVPRRSVRGAGGAAADERRCSTRRRSTTTSSRATRTSRRSSSTRRPTRPRRRSCRSSRSCPRRARSCSTAGTSRSRRWSASTRRSTRGCGARRARVHAAARRGDGAARPRDGRRAARRASTPRAAVRPRRGAHVPAAGDDHLLASWACRERDWPQLKEWCGNRATLALGPAGARASRSSTREHGRLPRLPARAGRRARRRDRADDFASALLAIHDEDPDALTHEEIASILFSLSFAGHETTNYLIGNLRPAAARGPRRAGTRSSPTRR